MYKLVVVDDEHIVVKGIEAILKREGLDCEVVGSANNGIDALEILHETMPHIVITDIRMPKLDGLSLIERARDFLPDTYFIIISGYKEFEYARKALSMGVISYIDKPITIDKIKEAFLWIEREEMKKKVQNVPASYDQKRANLDSYIDDMMKKMVDNDADGMKDIFERYRVVMRTYFPNLDEYKREALKMICVISEFYGNLDRGKEWNTGISFKEIYLSKAHSKIDCYIEKVIYKIAGNMVIETHSVNHKNIKELLDYIGNNYNKDIGLNELADRVSLNPAYLSLLFKEEVGMSYIKYLTQLRIKKAKEYLLEGYRISEVSEMVGYNNYRHFSDIFKKTVGQTPNEYKGCTRCAKEV